MSHEWMSLLLFTHSYVGNRFGNNCVYLVGCRALLFPAVNPRRRFLIHSTVKEHFPELATVSVGQGDQRRTAVTFSNPREATRPQYPQAARPQHQHHHQQELQRTKHQQQQQQPLPKQPGHRDKQPVERQTTQEERLPEKRERSDEKTTKDQRKLPQQQQQQQRPRQTPGLSEQKQQGSQQLVQRRQQQKQGPQQQSQASSEQQAEHKPPLRQGSQQEQQAAQRQSQRLAAPRQQADEKAESQELREDRTPQQQRQRQRQVRPRNNRSRSSSQSVPRGGGHHQQHQQQHLRPGSDGGARQDDRVRENTEETQSKKRRNRKNRRQRDKTEQSCSVSEADDVNGKPEECDTEGKKPQERSESVVGQGTVKSGNNVYSGVRSTIVKQNGDCEWNDDVNYNVSDGGIRKKLKSFGEADSWRNSGEFLDICEEYDAG